MLGKSTKGTNQIVQKGLPRLVRKWYDAAHVSAVIIFALECVNGCAHIVKNRLGIGSPVVRGFYWHSTFGTGAITASGHMIQPNIQEREFARYAPMLDSLDPANGFQHYRDLCRVGHACGAYFPAHEEFCPSKSFAVIECGDT